jgi:hypothetical protein
MYRVDAYSEVMDGQAAGSRCSLSQYDQVTAGELSKTMQRITINPTVYMYHARLSEPRKHQYTLTGRSFTSGELQLMRHQMGWRPRRRPPARPAAGRGLEFSAESSKCDGAVPFSASSPPPTCAWHTGVEVVVGILVVVCGVRHSSGFWGVWGRGIPLAPCAHTQNQ